MRLRLRLELNLSIKSHLKQVSFKAPFEVTNISLCLDIIRQTVPYFRATTLKALSAKVFLLVLGTINLSIIVSNLRPYLFGMNVIRRFCSIPVPCHVNFCTLELQS